MTPNTPPSSNNASRKRRYSEDFSDDDCSSPKSSPTGVDEDKRAHHNELERRRRDHIKDHFLTLKTAIPLLEGEKSSRALILKRAVDFINMLQTQTKEYKSEIDELKRRNEALVQQASGLRPFLTSLQLQTAAAPAAQPLFTAAAPVAPAAFALAPTTSAIPQPAADIPPYAFSRSTPASPHALNAAASPVQPNPNLLANISSLLLQNPALLNQLQQTAVSNPPAAFEPLTPPSSASFNELSDAQARLLASSLALRERQFAAAAMAQQQ
ncbi:Mxl-3 [Aphelenchoides fujianensis]|nr:Mxl-3 [Aphelenchoides fujianensis]